MAAKIKSLSTKDTRGSAKSTLVHYIKVNKSNKKGAAEAIGGTLYVHEGHATGDFHIVLETTINDKKKSLNLEAGDIVFRTNDNKRWQVGTVESLKKRFPSAKFA